MMTSSQIAGLFAQQQSMFSGAAAYSQQISASMPSAYSGMGTVGSMAYGPPQQSYPQVPFAPPQSPGFNYGNPMMGYGPGNAFAASAMSTGGGIAQGALGFGAGAAGLAGAAQGLGLIGSGGVMGGLARVGGFGLGLPVMAGAMVGQHMIGSMVQGAQEQSAIQGSLGQFQHFNAASRTGRGFSRQDAMQIGDMVRQLQSIPEMLTSTAELTRIMDKIGQMGLMQGVRDAKEFGNKFKQMIGGLKEVAKIMGTSMEEALPIFQEARRSGFYSAADITKNAMNRQVTGAMTGMNQQQVGQLQQFGAQLSFAMGGTRRTGATHATRTAQQLGVMNQMGFLSNDDIAELTGEEGAAGIQQLSGNLTQAAHSMFRSAPGNLMTMALGETKDGRYTGRMDEKMVAQLRRGEIGLGDLFSQARQKTGSRAAKLSYTAQRKKLTAEAAGQVGAEGIGLMLERILGDRGWEDPNAVNLVLQRFGLDERQSTQVQEIVRRLPEMRAEMASQSREMARRTAISGNLRENFSWDAVKKKIGKRLENTLTEPFKQIGAEIQNSVAESIDGLIDEITGVYSKELSKGHAAMFARAGAGDRKAAAQLSGLQKAAGRLGPATGAGESRFVQQMLRNSTFTGQIGSTLRGLAGTENDSERFVDLFKRGGSVSLAGTTGQLQGIAEGRSDVLSGVGSEAQGTAARLLKSTLPEIMGKLEGKSSLEQAQIIRNETFGRAIHNRDRDALKNLSTEQLIAVMAKEGLGGRGLARGLAAAGKGLGTMELSPEQEAERSKKLERELATGKGRGLFDKGFGSEWGSIREAATDPNSEKFKLLFGDLGSDKRTSAGLFGRTGGDRSLERQREELRAAISATAFGDIGESQKKILSAHGIDLSTKAGRDRAAEARKWVQAGGDPSRAADLGGKLEDFALSKLREGSLVSKEQRISAGKDIESLLAEKGISDALGRVKSGSGRGALSGIKGLASRLTKGEEPGAGAFGSIAEQIAGADKDERNALLAAGGGGVEAAYGTYRNLVFDRKGKRRKASSVEGYLKSIGISEAQMLRDPNARRAKKDLEDRVAKKGGKFDESVIQDFAKFMADLKGRGVFNVAGTQQAVKGADDTKLAGDLNKFATSVERLAAIVATGDPNAKPGAKK